MEKFDDNYLKELNSQRQKSNVINATEIRDKQVVVYIDECCITLVHLPSGREFCMIIPFDDFVERTVNAVAQKSKTDSSDENPIKSE